MGLFLELESVSVAFINHRANQEKRDQEFDEARAMLKRLESGSPESSRLELAVFLASMRLVFPYYKVTRGVWVGIETKKISIKIPLPRVVIMRRL